VQRSNSCTPPLPGLSLQGEGLDAQHRGQAKGSCSGAAKQLPRVGMLRACRVRVSFLLGRQPTALLRGRVLSSGVSGGGGSAPGCLGGMWGLGGVGSRRRSRAPHPSERCGSENWFVGGLPQRPSLLEHRPVKPGCLLEKGFRINW